MPMIQVDENVFHNNQRLVGVVQKMLAHPEARKKVLEAHKTIDPNAVIPEIDARKPVDDALASVTKRMEDFMAEQRAEKVKEKEDAQRQKFIGEFEAGRRSLRERGVTDDGLKAVEDLMAKSGIIDHTVGWAAFSQLNPEPEPAPPSPNFGFGGILGDVSKNPDEFIKSMHASKGNDEAALDKQIYEVLKDVRQQNGRQPQPSYSGFGRR